MNTLQRFKIEQHRASKLIRVLIVEDQEILRIGLKCALACLSNVQVAGMAFDGPSAVANALELKPDVIVMDIGLPGFDGLEATRRIKQVLDCCVLIHTSHSDKATIRDALDAGANGYCLKGASTTKLDCALKMVASGNTWFDEQISDYLPM